MNITAPNGITYLIDLNRDLVKFCEAKTPADVLAVLKTLPQIARAA